VKLLTATQFIMQHINTCFTTLTGEPQQRPLPTTDMVGGQSLAGVETSTIFAAGFHQLPPITSFDPRRDPCLGDIRDGKQRYVRVAVSIWQ
jgi:hypothetical protein